MFFFLFKSKMNWNFTGIFFLLLMIWGISDRAEIFDLAVKELELSLGDVCKSHGIDHAKQVLDHVQRALEVHQGDLDEERQILVLLAALLHDADDHKFFPKRDDGQTNAENILKVISNQSITSDQIEFVMHLIDLVSCSKNHNTVPEEAIKSPEILYPRYADRLEAIGEIGVMRCYQYNKTKGSPLFVSTTPKPTTEEELNSFLDNERFMKYDGNSNSMIDHYYDKLLHLATFSSGNSYLDNEASKRAQIMKDVCLYYGQHGKLHPIFNEEQKN